MNFTADNTTDRAPNWLLWLAEFKGNKCRGLEVGAYEGRSSIWFAENILTHPESTLLCIDQWQPIEPYTSRGTDMKEVCRRFIDNTVAYPKIRATCGSSAELFDRTLGEFDFAYIDGSHWPIDVLKDSIAVFELVKPGGIIIWDDYQWSYKGPLTEPKIAIDAFLSVYQGKYVLISMGYQVAVRKL